MDNTQADLPIPELMEVYMNHKDYGDIPERLLLGLLRYREKGILPGSFLQCMICNKFTETIGRADPVTITHIKALAMFMANEMPAPAWRSKDNMAHWIKFKTDRRR